MSNQRVSLKIHMPAEMADAVRAKAESEGRTVTGLVRMLLRQHLEQKTATYGEVEMHVSPSK